MAVVSGWRDQKIRMNRPCECIRGKLKIHDTGVFRAINIRTASADQLITTLVVQSALPREGEDAWHAVAEVWRPDSCDGRSWKVVYCWPLVIYGRILLGLETCEKRFDKYRCDVYNNRFKTILCIIFCFGNKISFSIYIRDLVVV